jgi:hypothetical protein
MADGQNYTTFRSLVVVLGVKGKMEERAGHFNQPGALSGQVPGRLQNTH